AENIGGIDFYAKGGGGLAFPDAKTLVIGSAAVSRDILVQKASGEVARIDEALQAALDKADMKAAVIVATILPEEVRKMIRGKFRRAGEQAFRRGGITDESFWKFAALSIPMRWGLSAQSATLTIDPDGEKGLTLLAFFADKESAAQIAALGQAFSRPISLGLKHIGLSDEERQRVAENMEEELAKLKPLYKIVARGKVVGLRVDVRALVPPIKKLVGSARGMALRMQSASNLRQLGVALAIYATSFKGQFPPNLDVLVEKGFLSDKAVLQNPGRAKHDPEGDYEYVSGLTRGAAPWCVIAYEKVDDLDKAEGLNVLFMDGYVEWMEPADFKKALKMTREKIAKDRE
ncbi:MAG: hypothetical protein QGD94_09015, partial [Planctomycetia bacterium]|nr:hypothetical protein [Planctomycetia bacterium]